MNQYLIENKAWLHRKGSACVWEFAWCEDRRLAVYRGRKHFYSIRYCRFIGLFIARLLHDEEGNEVGWVIDHKHAKPRELEFEHGGRYIFS